MCIFVEFHQMKKGLSAALAFSMEVAELTGHAPLRTQTDKITVLEPARILSERRALGATACQRWARNRTSAAAGGSPVRTSV